MRCEGPLTEQERSNREYSWKAEFEPSLPLGDQFCCYARQPSRVTVW
jgi:hypothetical protein